MPLRMGYAKLKGLIFNSRGIPNEQELVEGVADELETETSKLFPGTRRFNGVRIRTRRC